MEDEFPPLPTGWMYLSVAGHPPSQERGRKTHPRHSVKPATRTSTRSHPQKRIPTDVSVWSRQICQSKALVSKDRSEAATQPRTTAWLRLKSYTRDLAPLHCMGWISLQHNRARVHTVQELVAVAWPPQVPIGGSTCAYCCLPMPWR